jgi:hypothetical protein
MRLSTMIVLLVIVLLLMFTANRPEIWSRFFPEGPRPAETTGQAANTPTNPSTSAPAPSSRERQSPLMLGILIVAAIAYGIWRVSRIARAVSKRTQARRTARPPENPT